MFFFVSHVTNAVASSVQLFIRETEDFTASFIRETKDFGVQHSHKAFFKSSILKVKCSFDSCNYQQLSAIEAQYAASHYVNLKGLFFCATSKPIDSTCDRTN